MATVPGCFRRKRRVAGTPWCKEQEDEEEEEEVDTHQMAEAMRAAKTYLRGRWGEQGTIEDYAEDPVGPGVQGVDLGETLVPWLRRPSWMPSFLEQAHERQGRDVQDGSGRGGQVGARARGDYAGGRGRGVVHAAGQGMGEGMPMRGPNHETEEHTTWPSLARWFIARSVPISRTRGLSLG